MLIVTINMHTNPKMNLLNIGKCQSRICSWQTGLNSANAHISVLDDGRGGERELSSIYLIHGCH